MYTIKIIQSPQVIYDYYDRNFCKELESIISINGTDFRINIEGTQDGFFISYKNKDNKNIEDKDSIYFNEKTDIDIELEEGVNNILDQLAYATFYETIKEGDELTSEEILSWEF